KFLASKLVGQLLPTVYSAGYGNRMHAPLRHALESLLLQKLNAHAFRRPAAGIESVQLIGLRVINNREQVATDSIHHRLAPPPPPSGWSLWLHRRHCRLVPGSVPLPAPPAATPLPQSLRAKSPSTASASDPARPLRSRMHSLPAP